MCACMNHGFFIYTRRHIYIKCVCMCVFNSLASPSSLVSSFVFLSSDPLHRFQSMARLKQLKERIPILADLGELSPLYITPNFACRSLDKHTSGRHV